MTIINGIAYHGDSENHVRLVEEDETMPYVAMVEHQPIAKFTDSSVSNSEDFLSALTKRFPTKNPELAKQRQKQVINKMIEYKYLTQSEADKILKKE